MDTILVTATMRATADAFVPGGSKLYALFEVSQAARSWRQQRGMNMHERKLENLLSACDWYKQCGTSGSSRSVPRRPSESPTVLFDAFIKAEETLHGGAPDGGAPGGSKLHALLTASQTCSGGAHGYTKLDVLLVNCGEYTRKANFQLGMAVDESVNALFDSLRARC